MAVKKVSHNRVNRAKKAGGKIIGWDKSSKKVLMDFSNKKNKKSN